MAIAVVLCAGRGTRLWPVTEKTAKVMVRVAGKPLLEYLLEGIAPHFEKTVLVTAGENAAAPRLERRPHLEFREGREGAGAGPPGLLNQPLLRSLHWVSRARA